MGVAAILPALAVAGAVVGAAGAYRTAKAQQQTAEYEAEVAGQNAKLGDQEALDAEARGRDEEDRYRRQLSQLLGTQRTQTAALGLDLAPGSSAESLLLDTSGEGARDVAAIRQDAAREAYAARVGASSARGRQGLARAEAYNTSPGLAVTTSVLGSANQFAPTYYDLYGRRGTGAPSPGLTPSTARVTPGPRPLSPWVRR